MIGQKGVPATYGGIERHVEEIGARLVEAGHEVRVYTREHYSPGREPHRGMERVPTGSHNTKHLDTITHTITAGLHVLRHPVDLVHFHALGPSALTWLPRLRGMPVVVTLHGLDWEREKWGAMASYLLEKCEYPALHVPRRTIVVSRTLQRYFEEKYRIRPTYIPNGVNEAIPQPEDGLARWGLTSRGYYLFLGRLTPEKGAHFLTEAFPRVGSERKLVVAGGSAATDDYVEELQRTADPDRTLFTGYVHGTDLLTLLDHAYAVVLPSTLEGLSIALLEALAYGRCVLVSDIPENLEVVEEHAPRFRSGDVADLTRALTELDRDPARVAAYEEAVRTHLRDRFTWETVVSELQSVYGSVLEGERAPLPVVD
jgi:glycosyltransferase involved in cell wall biosynthesis